jgi:2,4-dienoyl-CoA reductase-like NADH-dependent reductase (Old Yellow Enzyme family)
LSRRVGDRIGEASLLAGEQRVVCDAEILTAPTSPLAAPFQLAPPGGSAVRRIRNRFCIHPMEGWDGTPDGKPSDWTRGRWINFGRSGAKLIWGGEAAAVTHAGRANPNQLLLIPENKGEISDLLESLNAAHRAAFGGADDVVVGQQLTHSGRLCRPDPDKKL